ncbi:hypothetical protein [uncultured Maritimibacter sp.]|jgi:hypothetical protein|uniref:hypothetical protein n=1 Tax=uncultured Maritimibacter sp. TaxID=991866 RepID=UPI00260B424D|nr:hypothetical protein [uncultured Maritimibacter sp.]
MSLRYPDFKLFGAVVAITSATANAAWSQASSPSATAMQTAADACMRNYGAPDQIAPTLSAAGFKVVPGMDEGTVEFSGAGINGIAAASPGRTYCSIQSTEVPLSVARGIGLGLAKSVFGYNLATENGSPEGQKGPCDGLNLLAPQRLIWIRYAQAGNSGACVDDGTSAIILDM